MELEKTNEDIIAKFYFSTSSSALTLVYKYRKPFSDMKQFIGICALPATVVYITMFEESGLYEGVFVARCKNEKDTEGVKTRLSHNGVQITDVKFESQISLCDFSDMLLNNEIARNVVEKGEKFTTIADAPFTYTLQVEIKAFILANLVALEITCEFWHNPQNKFTTLLSTYLYYKGKKKDPIQILRNTKEEYSYIASNNGEKIKEPTLVILVFDLETDINYSEVVVESLYSQKQQLSEVDSIDYLSRAALSKSKYLESKVTVGVLGIGKSQRKSTVTSDLFDVHSPSSSIDQVRVSKKFLWNLFATRKYPASIIEMNGYNLHWDPESRLDKQALFTNKGEVSQIEDKEMLELFLRGLQEGSSLSNLRVDKYNEITDLVMDIHCRDVYIPKIPSFWDYILWMFNRGPRDCVNRDRLFKISKIYNRAKKLIGEINKLDIGRAARRVHIVVSGIEMIPIGERIAFNQQVKVELSIRGAPDNYIYYVERECEWNQAQLLRDENNNRTPQCTRNQCKHNIKEESKESFSEAVESMSGNGHEDY